MKRKIYFVKKVSKKEGRDDFVYLQLIIDLGYAKRVVSMDADLISELVELPKRALYESETDKLVKVADFELVGD